MKLRGVDFGPVLDASGVRGFFGEGYAHHAFWKPFGLRFVGATFVAKTTTLGARAGNMPLDERWRPKEMTPRCVVVKPFAGIALNAVGLSGPGAAALFGHGGWQRRRSPFFLSFMSVATGRRERLDELRGFVALFKAQLAGFSAPVGLQMNFSCPNAGLDPAALADEVAESLGIAAVLGVPLMPKFNIILPIEAAVEIAALSVCDAICVSNTVPWGALPRRIDWPGLFGTETSPLARFGGGGLSGAPLLPLVEEWVMAARTAGIRKPINAGGGILAPADAGRLIGAGADSVFIGTMAMLRPWRVQKTIRHASTLLKDRPVV